MRKIFTCFVAVLAIAAAATGPARAQSNTVTWNDFQMQEFNLSSQGESQTNDDVTLTSNGGAAGDNVGSIYFNGAFTFSVPAGSVFTQIVIMDYGSLSVDVDNTGWSVNGDQTGATWTGSARSVACQIDAYNVQYIEFTIAPAVRKMYTSDVSITDLVPGDTLAEGATIIGSGNDNDMVYINFGRYKENGVVPQFWKNLGLPPTVIGTNGTISGTYTPVDANGRDGNAWVVTDAVINDYYGSFEVGLGGIFIPGPPHTVRFAIGNDGWTVQDVTASSSATAPAVLENVVAGDSLVATYSGTRKVKSVKAVKYVAEPVSLIVNPVVGQIIGSDGKNYDANATLPTGVTAAAKVCYVDGNGHGLAMALADEGDMNWTTAQSTCEAKTPAVTGGTWKLATKDEWQLMINAAGGFNNLKNGFSSVGGTNLESDGYWTNTENESDDHKAYIYYFNSNMLNTGWKTNSNFVRACLAF